jgi:phenylacetate-CoA ligase
VSIALEQPDTREHVTGKFVIEAREDQARDRRLTVAVELAAGVTPSGALERALADAIVAVLLRLNSEFANYVPAERRCPVVTLYPLGDPEYFPVGVKHRYSRK